MYSQGQSLWSAAFREIDMEVTNKEENSLEDQDTEAW